MIGLRVGDRVYVTLHDLGPATVTVVCNWRDNVELVLDKPTGANSRTNCETSLLYLVRENHPEPLF